MLLATQSQDEARILRLRDWARAVQLAFLAVDSEEPCLASAQALALDGTFRR